MISKQQYYNDAELAIENLEDKIYELEKLKDEYEQKLTLIEEQIGELQDEVYAIQDLSYEDAVYASKEDDIKEQFRS
jgi:prefoldin subunit 5